MRIARLTPAGVAERAMLDERSDDAGVRRCWNRSPPPSGRASSPPCATVERLLTAARRRDRGGRPGHPDAQHCIARVLRRARPPVRGGLRPARSASPRSRTSCDRRPGCCSWRYAAGRAGRLRRAEVPRGRADRDQAHVGRRLAPGAWASAGACSPSSRRCAAADGAHTVRLETNRTLAEAIAMYRRAGYVEVPRSTTSPTPTTGSRSISDFAGR